MQLAVVVAKKHQNIFQAGFTAIGPVLHMVEIGVTRFTATRIAACSVALFQGAANRGWNSAAAAPHVERPAAFVFQDGDEAGIAAQASGGCR